LDRIDLRCGRSRCASGCTTTEADPKASGDGSQRSDHVVGEIVWLDQAIVMYRPAMYPNDAIRQNSVSRPMSPRSWPVAIVAAMQSSIGFGL
jgi:hypothetical protein